MKIYENNYEITGGRIICTQRPFELIAQIKKGNKDAVLVTPLTKVKELISFSKDAALEKIVHEIIADESLINRELLEKIITNANELIGVELVEVNDDQNKLLKTVVDISEMTITAGAMGKILNVMSKYIEKIPPLIVFGFTVMLESDLEFIHLVWDLKPHIAYQSLPKVILHDHKSLIEIVDVDTLIGWLELKTKNVITEKNINNYLSGDESFLSYQIDLAIKSIK